MQEHKKHVLFSTGFFVNALVTNKGFSLHFRITFDYTIRNRILPQFFKKKNCQGEGVCIEVNI